MGSAVLAHSALEECKRQHPGAKIFFLIFERNKESVEVLSSLEPENILTISDRSFVRFAVDSLRFILWARRVSLDVVIDLELFSRATMILSYLSGAPRRVGFGKATSEGLYRGNLLTDSAAYNAHQHMPLNFLALVRTLSPAFAEREYLKESLVPFMRIPPRFMPTPEEVENIHRRLRTLKPDLNSEHRLVIVNPDPGEALPMRGWALEQYRDTMRQILSEYDKAIFIIMGLARSAEYARELMNSIGKSSVIDFTGKTANLREMLTLFTLSDVLLTTDSGPAHFASLTAIHSVVLFGPETPNLYRPLGERSISLTANLSCSPCLSAYNHRHTRCTNNRCMQQIDPEFVALNVRNALAANSETRVDRAWPSE